MILIIDNGSQYTHLIKRNCRDLDFEAEIINNKLGYEEIEKRKEKIEKIILSGGPSSVYLGNNGLSEIVIKKVFSNEWNIPLLGVCYGHQLIAHVLGGEVEKGKSAEYGITRIYVDDEDLLFKGVKKEFNAWASHYDEVKRIPKDFTVLAHSDVCKYESMKHEKKSILSVQFHPEVWHTEDGDKILANFLHEL